MQNVGRCSKKRNRSTKKASPEPVPGEPRLKARTSAPKRTIGRANRRRYGWMVAATETQPSARSYFSFWHQAAITSCMASKVNMAFGQVYGMVGPAPGAMPQATVGMAVGQNCTTGVSPVSDFVWMSGSSCRCSIASPGWTFAAPNGSGTRAACPTSGDPRTRRMKKGRTTLGGPPLELTLLFQSAAAARLPAAATDAADGQQANCQQHEAGRLGNHAVIAPRAIAHVRFFRISNTRITSCLLSNTWHG